LAGHLPTSAERPPASGDEITGGGQRMNAVMHHQPTTIRMFAEIKSQRKLSWHDRILTGNCRVAR
jgi:hypothetical protein